MKLSRTYKNCLTGILIIKLILCIGLQTSAAQDAQDTSGESQIECGLPLQSTDFIAEKEVLDDLIRLGFITRTERGNNYHPDRLSNHLAVELVEILKSLEAAENISGAISFYIKLAGTDLVDNAQTKCFIRSHLLLEEEGLTEHLTVLSRLIARQPNVALLQTSMRAIALEMNNDQTLDFLSSVRAVYFTGSGTGVGVNPSNARFNKTRMEHIPNEIMQIFAANIEESSPAMGSIIYQIEHMGHDRGIAN